MKINARSIKEAVVSAVYTKEILEMGGKIIIIIVIIKEPTRLTVPG